ncbi:MAG TPA: hypothetical protein VHA15_03375 [Burkholderiales bacterium]|nr:hypothetical protein [Burkholderiales bacterium]
MPESFAEALRTQCWDDHRVYHHSCVNQTLHFISTTSFLTAYVMLFFHPVAAALTGWLVAMTTRQAGHFFFEPGGFDEVNQVTHEYKEEIKVGYNLHRKVVLLPIWALPPWGRAAPEGPARGRAVDDVPCHRGGLDQPRHAPRLRTAV